MIRPIRNNIVVKPFPPDEKTTGGIFVPESCREENNKVLIVAVGDGLKDKPMNLKAGQVGFRVKGHKAAEIEIDGELHLIMEQEAILATLEEGMLKTAIQ
jgi:chaperonin GroES